MIRRSHDRTTPPRACSRRAGGAARVPGGGAREREHGAMRARAEVRVAESSSSSPGYRGTVGRAAAIRFVEVSQPSYYKIITPDYNHAAGRSI